MPISFTNYQPGTPEQVSPYANLVSNAMKNYQSAVASRYAPQTTQADIFNKEFAPLAQIASSPLALAMLPEQRQQMAQLISQLLQQTGGSGGSSNGIASFFRGGQNQGQGGVIPSNNANNISQGENGTASIAGGTSSQTPGLPSTNFQQGAAQKVTAPYSEQLHPAGTTYNAGNEPLVTPAGNVVGGSQETLNSIANLKDFVPNYAEQAREFTTPQGSLFNRIKSGASAVAGRIGANTLSKALSKDPDLEGRWNNLVQEKNRLGVIAQHVFPTTTSKEGYEKHMEMLELRPTDTYKSFSKRINQFMSDLDTAEQNAKRAMNAGKSYNLNPESKNIYGPSNAVSNEMKNHQSALKGGVERIKNIGGTTFHKINGQWVPYLGDQ